VDNGIGVSSDSSTITINSLDEGIVNKALETVSQNDAINGEGFNRLLELAGNLFQSGGELIDKTSSAALGAVEAVNTAKNDEEGRIDQKTLVICAVAGVSAVYLMRKK
jgi:hypothetical protein